MPFNSNSLRRSAKQAMQSAVPSAIVVTLVYLLLTDVLSSVVSAVSPGATLQDLVYGRGYGVWISLFLSVLLTLYQMVMSFGYSGWALGTARGQTSDFGALMDGFGMVGRVIWMEILIFLHIFGWTLLASMVYSTVVFMFSMLGDVLFAAAMAAATAVFYVFVIVISLRYELSPFLLYDYPEAGSNAAVRRSAEMMRGRTWSFIKLHLSFWKWYLLEFVVDLVASALVLALVLPDPMRMLDLVSQGNLQTLVFELQSALSAPFPALLTLAAGIPVQLFFLPYLRIAVANFYRALSQEPVEPAFSGETF